MPWQAAQYIPPSFRDSIYDITKSPISPVDLVLIIKETSQVAFHKILTI